MKLHTRVLPWLAIPVLLSGCGGGGGSSSGGGGTPAATPVFEAIQTTNPTWIEDLGNVQTGDGITFQLVTYSLGVRTVLTTSGWNTNNSGAIDPSSGALIATGASTTPYTIATTYNGQGYSTSFTVTPQQAWLSGRVVEIINMAAKGVRAVKINFYKPNGSGGVTYVSSVTSGYDGTFHASLPTAVTSFQVDLTSLNKLAIYESSYTYNNLSLSASVTNCLASVPALTNGVNTNLPTNIVLTQTQFMNGPPPPPTGCS